MDNTNQDKNLDDLLRSIPDEQFDGHTEFENLTPQQRLDWLAAAVQFWYKYGKPKSDLAKEK